MMKLGNRLLAMLLCAVMVLNMACISGWAAPLVEGTNGKTMYLSVQCTDENGTVLTSAAAGAYVYVRVSFAGNSTVLEESVTNYNLLMTHDAEKFSFIGFDKDVALTTPTNNSPEAGHIMAGWANPEGIYVQKGSGPEATNEIQSSGLLAMVYLQAKTAVTAEDLASVQIAATYGADSLKMGQYTVVVAPALQVTVKPDTMFYNTTTAAQVKQALEVKCIDETGTATAVTDFTVSGIDGTLATGENDVTVEAGGLRETIRLTAQEDTVTSISVTDPTKLQYVSGERLSLSGMTVTAHYASGSTNVLDSYTTSVADNTALTVQAHNGQRITVTVDGKTAQTSALRVSPRQVMIPTAEGSYVYTGEQQTFTIGNQSGSSDYTLTGDLSGKDADSYEVQASLKDKTETQWSDGTVADQTLRWTILPNTGVLTVTLTGETTLEYTGRDLTPAVTVMAGDKLLVSGTDYTLRYTDHKNAGQATVRAKGIGNYAGASGSAHFTITPVVLTENDLTFSGSTTKEYDGTTAAPSDAAVVVKAGVLKEQDTLNVQGIIVFNSADVASAEKLVFTAQEISTGNYRLAAGTKLETGANITAKTVTSTRAEVTQNIVKGVGRFTEPTFADVTGTLQYRYNGAEYDYAALQTVLAACANGDTGTVNWTYTASGNYQGTITGTIAFTIVDIAFTVDGAAATAANALNIKENAVYGDSWTQIVQKKDGVILTASVDSQTDSDQSHFALVQTGKPNAGNAVAYDVVYTGELGGVRYENAPVISGTVAVLQKELTVTAGSYRIEKEYDGTTAAGTGSGSLHVSGVLDADAIVVQPAAVPMYTDPNVGGQSTLDVTLSLDGTGKENYRLSASSCTVPCQITKRPITLTDVTLVPRDYAAGNTTVTVSDVTFSNLAASEALTAGRDYTASGTMTDAQAGTKSVTVTVQLQNGNYALARNTFTKTVEIRKIAYPGEKTLTAETKYGAQERVVLAEKLPQGAVLGTPVSTDPHGIFTTDGTPTLSGTTLCYQLAARRENVGKSATVRIPVTSTNYQPFDLEVTVTVLDKKTQTLTAETISVSYGDTFTVGVSGAKTTISYAVRADSSQFLNLSGNRAVALDVGTAYLTATAAETEEYAAATLDIPVQIGKRALYVKADNITAYIGADVPTPRYTVSGFVGGDTWVTEPVLSYAAAPDMTTDGEYVIDISGADAGSRYEIRYESGKLTVTNAPTSSRTPISVSRPANGTVQLSTKTAVKGTTVTITVTPDSGYALETLAVYDRNGNRLELTELGDGRYSFVMPRGTVTVEAAFAPNTEAASYADVAPEDWFYDAVQYMTRRGLMNGTGDGFAPNAGTSRAMIWTILARLEGAQLRTDGVWYEAARQWAVQAAVSDGKNATGRITREQFAVMLYRYAVQCGLDVSAAEEAGLDYVDVDAVSEYALAAVRWACDSGILSGIGNRLAPQSGTTRAQAATMLMRYLKQFAA